MVLLALVMESAIYAQKPIFAWVTPLSGAGHTPLGRPALFGSELFFATSIVSAYEAASGRLIWETPVLKYVPRGLVADEKYVYVCSDTVEALNRRTGHEAWETKSLGNSALATPALGDGRLYVGTASHMLYALDATTGKEEWGIDVDPKAAFPSYITGVLLSRNKLFVTLTHYNDQQGNSSSGRLVAVDAHSGTMVWSLLSKGEKKREGYTSAPVRDANLLIILDGISNTMSAVSVQTGALVWSIRGKAGFIGFSGSPAIVGKRIYAASGDTDVYSVDVSTGKLLWQQSTGGSNTALTACGNKIIVSNQRLTVLDPDNGTVLMSRLSPSIFDTFSSQFAASGTLAYIAGPTALYGIQCGQ